MSSTRSRAKPDDTVFTEGNVTKIHSTSGNTYYVTRHSCPSCDGEIYMCSCPHFMMGIASRGGNPFAEGCKHIAYVKDHQQRKRKKK